MRALLAVLIILSATSVWADDTVAKIQETLKEQGFYYGQITGQKDADTSAAIRRYQIRNGLQVTGDLNDETLQSLRNTAAAKPATTPAPAPSVSEGDTSDLRAENPRDAVAPNQRLPQQPFAQVSPNQPAPIPPPEGRVVPSGDGLFGDTPYATAPTEVQRRVVSDAQKILGRRGLYRGPVDGYYGPDLEFSLRAYQSRVGLPVSGRLDLETLAALELLPGAHTPVYIPPRRRAPFPPGMEPPVRGEWVRP